MNRPNPKLAALWDAERRACEPADEHHAAARRTVELVRAAGHDSEYLVKLKALAEAAAMHVRDRALWCSAITLHIRWRRQQLERSANADAPPIETGRQLVAGHIVMLDIRTFRNFAREVMTVQDGHGRKFWGTQPRFLYEAKEGDPVAPSRHSSRLQAEWTPSSHRPHTLRRCPTSTPTGSV